MDIEFIADDPQAKARTLLDSMLTNGRDQVAIACAFCTGAGVELLLRHRERLHQPESFVVISTAIPTDYGALAKIHHEMPGRLFVHWGKAAPVEKKNGSALMHSKVFFARAGHECWLWVGSHNLTGNATQGGNCEAAVLLHGSINEEPFKNAIAHLQACRSEAIPYDPETRPPSFLERASMIAVHAEARDPRDLEMPCRIELCLETPEYDGLLSPPSDVLLYLYRPGALDRGWQFAEPVRAFGGKLTGQNLTAQNPVVSNAGTDAAWPAANHSMLDRGGCLDLLPYRPASAAVTTQAILYIDRLADKKETYFSERPTLERTPIYGQERRTPVDKDMQRYFRREDVEGGTLRHVPIVNRSRVLMVAEGDSRITDRAKIEGVLRDMYEEDVSLHEDYKAYSVQRHPCIVRVKYRLKEN